ncbi:hypothetical protein NPS53_08085 [Pseudomonas putida]|uniref:hypothetical protein n=1 Tax=Pseudomonas putida TaxID=303 RepID=UPI0023644EEF|nr:hypothetical protein [Pseudomonas putida]MDD2139529.1 hypothetical protein [Pseudomonas putida]HDS1721452.1 hypothetical protein [Pseudomonas putida]
MKIAILVDSHDDAAPLAELALDIFSEATSCESNLSLRRELKESPRPDLILVQVSNLAGRLDELAALHSGLDGSGYVPLVVVAPSADTELHDQLASKGLDMLFAPVAAKAFEAMVCMCLPDHMEAFYAERRKARSEACS